MRKRPVSVAIAAAAVVGMVLLAATAPVRADDAAAERQRAQLRQLQMQLQRAQQDNAALEQKANEAEALKSDVKTKQAELAKVRAEVQSRTKESSQLQDEVTRLQAEIAAAKEDAEKMRQEIAHRDQLLLVAAQRQAKSDAEAALLTQRLKVQTAFGDECSSKHAKALKLADTVIDRLEQDRLRLCEPVTGIWKVRHENGIQALRESVADLVVDAAHPQQP